MRFKMPTVTQETRHASKAHNGRKYALMNYEQIKFDAVGQVSRLHVEGRYLDGNLSPATTVAHVCLLYGLMLKAVEISRYGILEAGNKAYMDKQYEIHRHLCNNDGPWEGIRYSKTKGLDPYIPELQKQSRQLIRLIKITLSELSPADDILWKLADKPLALRLAAGDSWDKIESDLCPTARKKDDIEQNILRFIELGAICECENIAEWVDTAAHQLADIKKVGTSKEKTEKLRQRVEKFIVEQKDSRQAHWSETLGGFLNG